MTVTIWLIGITIFLLAAERCSGQCQDLDSQACEALFLRDPNLCQDPKFSTSVCPRFCNQCPLECYHCETPIDSPEKCMTTRTCGVGELCMMLHTTTTADGIHNYEMNCATTTFCDGNALLAVGKRGVHARNINIECCSSDLCNKPADTTTTLTTWMMPTTEYRCTADSECVKIIQCAQNQLYKCDHKHHHCKCEVL